MRGEIDRFIILAIQVGHWLIFWQENCGRTFHRYILEETHAIAT